MKTISCFLLAVLALMTSCSESSYEAHQTYFYPLGTNEKTFYADQELDSVRIISLDSWSISTSDWFTVMPVAQNIPAGIELNTKVNLRTTPNLTGKPRIGQLSVASYFNLNLPVYQLSWLNITVPYPEYDMNESMANRVANFNLNIVPESGSASPYILFTVYADNATLASDADWLVPAETRFKAGRHQVSLSCPDNRTGAVRTATLKLTSNGVTSSIKVTQEPVKE